MCPRGRCPHLSRPWAEGVTAHCGNGRRAILIGRRAPAVRVIMIMTTFFGKQARFGGRTHAADPP